MTRRESLRVVRMDRVALVAPTERLEPVLRAVREAGMMQLEEVAPDASLADASAAALRREAASAFVGWMPRNFVGRLHELVAPFGGSVVRLRRPRGVWPPTLVPSDGRGAAFQPLVDTYTTIPYRDLNPVLFAGAAYIVMFGMMFGDVGHGALLVAVGLVLLLTGRPRFLLPLRRLAPFVIGGGLAAMVFGFLYGEAFGPTHLVPTVWVAPLDHPTTLIAVAIGVGAVLLAAAYGIGSVNRWREGGFVRSLVDLTGLAGASVYLGLGLLVLGWYVHAPPALVLGAVFVVGGVTLGFLGCWVREGGVVSAIELFDSVLRMGTNTVSFARLAAFGLTHAALEQIVWSGTEGLWRRGAALWLAAAVLFFCGNALAFALEGLVAGIQALRLDYYELFSRVFVSEGQPFRPWRFGEPSVPPSASPSVSKVPLPILKEDACSVG